jgi:branched-subunit amino acid aminotransferase/4-amino-4-deoxychorismate lyase
MFVRTLPLEKLPESWQTEGARIVIAEGRRDPAGILYGHKTLNYLENVLLRDRARQAGAADAILQGLHGEVLEGCVSNLFLVKKGRIATPSLDQHILPGVTRRVVLELAARAEIPVEERTVKVDELTGADELFLTNAIVEVLPVTQVGTARIGGAGPITEFLRAGYRRRVDEETRT